MKRREREIEDERPLNRWEELRQWKRTPEGRFEARLRCLNRHRDHYVTELQKMEEFLRQHPEVREVMPNWLRDLLARRAQHRQQERERRRTQPRLVVNNKIAVIRPQPRKRERLDPEGPEAA